MKRLLLLLITGYQKFISPLKPGCCRFTPTCSSYMMQAVGRFGVLKGTLLGICRILRCNPFFSGGFDPVPFCFTLSGRQLPRVPLKIRSSSPSGNKPISL